tara:strand:+ start:898 stop:1188 length:291 start_codon:yes stop_codon:yes gene_type:complete
MEIVSKETFEQIKAGVKLAGKVSSEVGSIAANRMKSAVNPHQLVDNMMRGFDEDKRRFRIRKEIKSASKIAKTTAKVTATCAVALVGGLFAAIIAD